MGLHSNKKLQIVFPSVIYLFLCRALKNLVSPILRIVEFSFILVIISYLRRKLCFGVIKKKKKHVKWYVARNDQTTAFGYVCHTDQIATLGYVFGTNHITAFGYLAPIIAFRVCVLHQSECCIRLWSHTNHIRAFGYLSPITVFRVYVWHQSYHSFLANDAMESGGCAQRMI